MLKRDMSKIEIEEFLKGKGDFVQIDHLSRMIQEKEIPIDKKRFMYQKLAELYEKKGMFAEAAKMYNNNALLCTVFAEKIKNHLNEAKLHIKAGNFVFSDDAVKKAMVEANVKQRAEMFVEIKEFYKKEALAYEKISKRAQAAKIYEKMLGMTNVSETERQEIKEKLKNLYEKLGRIRDYFLIKDNKMPTKETKPSEARGSRSSLKGYGREENLGKRDNFFKELGID